MARARSLSEFQKAFSDEASCVAFLFKQTTLAGRSSALAAANAARRRRTLRACELLGYRQTRQSSQAC